jgi:hypothetical protein
MRIFYAGLVIVVAAILFMLPVSESVYAFRTDLRSDTFPVTTAVGVTSANVTLLKTLYDNDTDTITFDSDIGETPVYGSYNTTTRQLLVTGLTASTSRNLVVSYDVAAFTATSAINRILDKIPFVYMLMIFCFAPAAIAAIFLGKA